MLVRQGTQACATWFGCCISPVLTVAMAATVARGAGGHAVLPTRARAGTGWWRMCFPRVNGVIRFYRGLYTHTHTHACSTHVHIYACVFVYKLHYSDHELESYADLLLCTMPTKGKRVTKGHERVVIVLICFSFVIIYLFNFACTRLAGAHYSD